MTHYDHSMNIFVLDARGDPIPGAVVTIYENGQAIAQGLRLLLEDEYEQPVRGADRQSIRCSNGRKPVRSAHK